MSILEPEPAVKVKEEPIEYICTDEIKIEEPDLIETDFGSPLCCLAPQSGSNQSGSCGFIIEKEWKLCVLCKDRFELNLANSADSSPNGANKCNKCILHARLNKVFNRKAVGLEDNEKKALVAKIQMIVCQTCGQPFERGPNVRLQQDSDYLNCSKCILHTRLNLAFLKRKVRCKERKKAN